MFDRLRGVRWSNVAEIAKRIFRTRDSPKPICKDDCDCSEEPRFNRTRRQRRKLQVGTVIIFMIHPVLGSWIGPLGCRILAHIILLMGIYADMDMPAPVRSCPTEQSTPPAAIFEDRE